MTFSEPLLAERAAWAKLSGEDARLLTDFVVDPSIFDQSEAPASPSSGGEASRPCRVVVDRIDRLPDRLATDEELPVLVVGFWLDRIYVGPVWCNGTAGCPKCLLTRLANSPFGPDQAGNDVAAVFPGVSNLPGGRAFRRIVSMLVLDRTAQSRLGRASNLAVSILDTSSFTIRSHDLVPDSTCPMCSSAEPRAAVDPRSCSSPITKLAGSLRTMAVDGAALADRYLTTPLGLFRGLRHDLQSPVASSSVELPPMWGRREPAIGRAATYDRSRSISILEGLERYVGLHRGGRQVSVRAPYTDVRDHAVLPTTFGVHPESSYSIPGFRHRRFDPNLPVDWVEAFSFRSEGAVLIPERAAFWGPRRDGEPSFFYDTSNGCAVGASIPEATLHGLRELIERDSYLLTWYRQLRLPEIDLQTSSDPELRHLLRRTSLFTGFEIRAFESTMEHGMPSVWLTALGRDPDGPLVVTGAAAHPDPVQALISGLFELGGSVLAAQHRYPSRRAAASEMVRDPNRVVTMEDHSITGAVPEALERFAFLLDTKPSLAISDLPVTLCRGDPDIRADLAVSVDALVALGLDVLVVDQTMPELQSGAFSCVKVVVPGLMPMTFGHANRRTEHLARLGRDYRLPYPSMLSAEFDLNQHPHPFP